MLSRFNIKPRNSTWPGTHLYPKPGIICNRDHSFLFENACFCLNILLHSYIMNDTNQIYNFAFKFMLLKKLNIFYRNKIIRSRINRSIIWYFHYFCRSLKDQTKIIFNRSISLVWQLDLTSRKKVNIPLFYHLIIFFCIFLEKCSLDLSSMQIH